MTQSFIESWELFGTVYLTSWLIAVSLSLIGVLVVAKDQIFIGAAVSQASALGVALAMWAVTLSGAAGIDDAWLERLPTAMAVTFSLLAALLTARLGGGQGETREAVTGWVYLISASLSVLVVSRSPHGLEEIRRLASSSLIGATEADQWLFAGLAASSALLLCSFHRRILLLTVDPPMAAAAGVRVNLWTIAIAAWLGVSVGLSLRVSGMLYTFACLVLPALVAKNVCRRMRSMFFVSPAVALLAAVAGSVLANYYDYPPAQLIAALLSLVLVLAWACRRALRQL